MPTWMANIFVYANTHFAGVLFILFGLVAVFYQVSRRMNARVEPAAYRPRRLQRMAQTLLAKKSHTGIARLLQKTDWLLYEKLKLLPDARTGRRLNFFLMLYASLALADAPRLFLFTRSHLLMETYRNHAALSAAGPAKYPKIYGRLSEPY